MQEKEKKEWVEDRVFEDQGMVVRVLRLSLGRPRFSIEVGARVRDRNNTTFVGRRFAVMTSGTGKIQIENRINTEVLSHLIKEAEEYVLTEAQASEDAYIERLQAREQRRQPRQPRQHAGLKRLRQNHQSASN